MLKGLEKEIQNEDPQCDLRSGIWQIIIMRQLPLICFSFYGLQLNIIYF